MYAFKSDLKGFFLNKLQNTLFGVCPNCHKNAQVILHASNYLAHILQYSQDRINSKYVPLPPPRFYYLPAPHLPITQNIPPQYNSTKKGKVIEIHQLLL